MADSDNTDFDYTGGYDPDEANSLEGMDRAMYVLSHRANAAVNSGKMSQDDAINLLMQKKDALEQLHQQYGDKLFENFKAPDKLPFTKPDFSDVNKADFSDVKSEVSDAKPVTPSLADQFVQSQVDLLRGAERGALEAGRGLSIAAAGANELLPDAVVPWTQEQALENANKLQALEQQVPVPSGTVGKVVQGVGAFVPGFMTAGAGAAGASGQDVIQQGGTLGQAETALGISAASNELGMAAGYLPGSNVAARLATQAAVGGALTEGSRQLRNEVLPKSMQEDFDPVTFGLGVGAASLGAFGEHGTTKEPTPKIVDTPPIGEPSVDAGIRAANDIKNNLPPVEPEVSPQGDLFGAGEQQTAPDLEREYLAQQQDKLDISRAFQEPETFQPSTNPTVEQNQVQGSLRLPTVDVNTRENLQARLSNMDAGGQFGEVQDTKPQINVEPTSPDQVARPAPGADGWDKVGNQPGIDVNQATGRPEVAWGKTVPQSLKDAYDSGNFTSSHILDAWTNNHDRVLSPTQVEFGKSLKDYADATGGTSNPIQVHNDPGIWENYTKNFGHITDRTPALFDPSTNSIVLNPNASSISYNTLMHETVHGYTYKAIQDGYNGKLTGPAKQSFDFLNNMLDTFKPELTTAANDRYLQAAPELGPDAARSLRVRETYGLTNLHELQAEFFSSPTFRESLKEMPLDNIQAANQGMGRLVLGKVRNMYDAVRNGFMRMIGVSPKADTAYDALSAAQADFMNKTVEARKSQSTQASDYQQVAAAPPVAVTNIPQQPERPIGRVEATLRGLTGLDQPSRKAVLNAKSDATSATNWSRISAEALVHDMKSAATSEKVPIENLQAYNSGKDATALDNYPKTKDVADQYRDRITNNAKQIAQNIATNPSSTRADFAFAHSVLDNNAYQLRGYQSQEYSQRLVQTAKVADDVVAKGGSLTDAQAHAKQVVDTAKNFFKQRILPQSIPVDLDKISLNDLRDRAKYLGVTPASVINRLGKGATQLDKKTALSDAIKNVVPDSKAAEVAVNRLLDDATGKSTTVGSPLVRYSRGIKFGDIMTARDDVPSAIRNLWGQLSDPYQVAVQTLVKQERGIAQLNQQAAIKQQLEGKALFPDKISAPDGYTARLNGKKYGVLKDMYTTPAMKTLLQGSVEVNTAANDWQTAMASADRVKAARQFLTNKAADWWMSGIKAGKTFRLVSDPLYYPMFAAGGPQIALSNGVLNPAYGMRGFIAHLSELSPAFLRNLPEGMRAQAQKDLETVVRSGMNENTATAEHFDRMQARKLAEALSKGQEQSLGENVWNASKMLVNKGVEAFSHALGLTDGWARRAALLNRIDTLTQVYKETGQNVSPEAIRQEAANWVKDTTLNSARAPGAAVLAERLGVFQGLLYPIETVRNMYHAFEHGLSDIKRGNQIGSNRLMYEGTKQIGGTTAALTLYSSLLMKAGTLGMSMLGLSTQDVDPNDKRQGRLQQPGERTAGMELQQIKTSDPNNQYYWSPADMNQYYYGVTGPMFVAHQAIADAMSGKQVDLDRALKNAAAVWTQGFFRNATVNRALAVVEAKPPSWYAHAPDNAAYLAESAKYQNMGLSKQAADRVIALNELFRPGILRSMDKAAMSKAPPDAQRLLSLGVGVTQMPSDAGLSDGTGKGLQKNLTEGNKPLMDALHGEQDLNNDVISKRYVDALKNTAQQMTLLKQDMDYAKAVGADPRKVALKADINGVDKNMLGLVLQGKMLPAQALHMNIMSSATKELESAQGDPDKQQHIIQMYKNRAGVLRDLTNKYKNLNVDEVGAL